MNKKIRFGRFFALATLVLLLATIAITAVKLLHREVDAITQNGETVNVEMGLPPEYPSIQYGDPQRTTHRYFVTNAENITHKAYCANPMKGIPDGSDNEGGQNYEAELLSSAGGREELNHQKIKLLIYVSTVDTAANTNIMNQMFDGQLANDTPDQRYAYVHAMIGYYFEGCEAGICPEPGVLAPEVSQIPDIIDDLIDNNNPAWLIAKNYNLYGLKRDSLTYPLPEDDQNIVWIENAAVYGNLTVKKCDSEGSTDTECRGPRAGTNFDGITFTLYNKTGDAILWNNRVYDNHAAMATYTLENGNDTVTFENLPIGEYQVAEGGNNDYYTVTAPNQTTDVTSNNAVLYFHNTLNTGNLIVQKCNGGNGDNDCPEPQTGTNFNGIKFELYNSTGGTKINECTLEDGNTYCEFTNLPIGTYQIKELQGSNIYYSVEDEDLHMVTVSTGTTTTFYFHNDFAIDISLDTTAVDADGDKFVLASSESIIEDTVNYCLLPNQPFTIRGWLVDKATKKPIMNDDENIITSSKVVRVGNRPCGKVEMQYEFDSTKLAGQEIVVFVEAFYGDGTSAEEPELIAEHKDIDDDDQTVYVISLETYAGDVDGGKEIVADENAKIIDVMSYCLVKGQKFTVLGTLMDKKTEKPILINDETVEQTIELEVEDEACGESEMVFEFDATEFADSDIVVFTYVYNDDDTTTSKPILPHADFTNPDQTVHIVPKTPDTGLSIRQSDSGSESSMMYIGVSIAALSIAAYLGARIYSRRSFLYRSR